MDTLMSFASTFFTRLPEWIAALLAVVGGASAVAALTPTPRDDRLLTSVKRFLNLLALNVGHARNAEDES